MRLYLLPGVLHCGGGKGPANADLLAILRDWEENGIPPGKVVVTKMESGKELISRPVYPYPREAIHDGQGDPNVETSYVLKE